MLVYKSHHKVGSSEPTEVPNQRKGYINVVVGIEGISYLDKTVAVLDENGQNTPYFFLESDSYSDIQAIVLQHAMDYVDWLNNNVM